MKRTILAFVAVLFLTGCTQLPVNTTDPVATLQHQVEAEAAIVLLAETPIDALIISGKLKGKDAQAVAAAEAQIDLALTKAADAASKGQATNVNDLIASVRALKTSILQIYAGYQVPATQP